MEKIAATCPTRALAWFHEQVLGILEKPVPVKKKSSKNQTQDAQKEEVAVEEAD